MNIFLFGATGPTGQITLGNLLEDGHEVTILVRSPGKIQRKHKLLTLVKGDVFDPNTYIEQMRNQDVVVSILGNGSNNKPTTIYSEGGKHILTTMKKVGVKKLITVTSGGVQKDDPVIQKSFFYKYFGLWYLRHVYADMEKWEQILEQNNDIDWVCVRPTYLRNGKLTQKYRVNTTYSPEKGWKISRADLADFITKQVDSDEFIHQKPVVAY